MFHPLSPDYTPASLDYSPASDTEFDPSEDPSSDHIPPLPATSPFLSSIDDSSDSDTPPSPTHGTPFTETTLSTQRHSVDYSSSDHFSSDDSLRDISSSSSSKSYSDSLWSLYLIQKLVVHLLIIHYQHHHRVRDLVIIYVHWYQVFIVHLLFLRDHLMILLLRSLLARGEIPLVPVASVPLFTPTLRALSYAHADLLPSPKRIRSPESATDLEDCSEHSFKPYVPREVGLGVDFKDESSEPSRFRGANLEMDVDVVKSDGIDIEPEIQAEIDEYFAYADALRYRGLMLEF
ncbi:hypothetical protein Tco_1268656 [Tanacetum coccineum]